MPIFPHGLFRRLPITLLLLSVAPAALAQAPAGAIVQPLPRSTDPAELLAQALRTLATEPANLPALTAAGRNALILGDPNAAVGFFGRAQEIAPTNGAVKAGLGSALVQLEKPQDALRLFAEASRLGVPDADIAEDRGLAYDLTGQQGLAQRDYQTVLAAHPDDDTARRRLALSQGISGNKAGAIATLDPLIRKRDIAGWRAQTFVLAMTGDAKGASSITHIMLPTQADALQPFLERLPQLSAIDKARAVHFGEMPAQGRAYTPSQIANVGTTPTYAAQPAPAPVQTAQASDLAMPVPAAAGHYDLPHVAAERSRGQARSTPPRTVVPSVVRSEPAPGAAAPIPQPMPQPTPVPAQPAPAPAVVAQQPATWQPAPQPSAAAPVTPPAQIAAAPTPAPSAQPPQVRPIPESIATVDLPASQPAPQPRPVVQPPVAAPRPAPVPAKMVGTPVVHGDEARIAEATEKARAKADARAEARKAPEEPVATKPPRSKAAKTLAAADDEDVKPAKGKKAKPPVDDEDNGSTRAKTSKSAKAKAKAAAEKPEPARVYVQVAGGANRDDMDKAWATVRKKAPELMKGHPASTVPVKSTNRLVVGPFKDKAEAQAFVNKASGKGVSAFVVTSEKGQKVEKLGDDG